MAGEASCVQIHARDIMIDEGFGDDRDLFGNRELEKDV